MLPVGQTWCFQRHRHRSIVMKKNINKNQGHPQHTNIKIWLHMNSLMFCKNVSRGGEWKCGAQKGGGRAHVGQAMTPLHGQHCLVLDSSTTLSVCSFLCDDTARKTISVPFQTFQWTQILKLVSYMQIHH